MPDENTVFRGPQKQRIHEEYEKTDKNDGIYGECEKLNDLKIKGLQQWCESD
jgi:hypothetical protein